MDKIKPKFHVGDVVTNISGLYPNVSPTISEVNIENQYYRYKEIGGITWFKDQDKLKLVDIDNCEPPVEENTNIAITENNAVEDVYLYLNVEKIKIIQAKAVGTSIGSSIIEPIIRDIKKAAAEGKSEIRIKYKDYNIINNNIPYVCHWARICGFIVSCYDELMYIKW